MTWPTFTFGLTTPVSPPPGVAERSRHCIEALASIVLQSGEHTQPPHVQHKITNSGKSIRTLVVWRFQADAGSVRQTKRALSSAISSALAHHSMLQSVPQGAGASLSKPLALSA